MNTPMNCHYSNEMLSPLALGTVRKILQQNENYYPVYQTESLYDLVNYLIYYN